MTHPLVIQLNYAKQRWLDGHVNLSEADAGIRLGNGNTIGWMVGHLAHFDQLVWLEWVQEKSVTDVVKVCDFGLPASAPSLPAMLDAWHAIQAEVQAFMAPFTEADLGTLIYPPRDDGTKKAWETYAVTIQRQTWHYWYHLGEMQTVRQALKHENLPQFVDRKIPFDVQYKSG